LSPVGSGYFVGTIRRGVAACLLLLPFFLAALPTQPAAAQTELPALSDAEVPALPLPEHWKGDFDEMKERRVIRILVPFSKTIYFLDKGAERGTAAELGHQFESCINKKYKTQRRKIYVAFVPIARNRLLLELNEGLGDIVAANLTITPERQKLVDFSVPEVRNVD